MALISSVGTIIFSISLILIPFLPDIPLAKPYKVDLPSLRPSFETERQFKSRYLLHRAKARLYAHIARHGHPITPIRTFSAKEKPFSVVAGFYVNWDETSLASLKLHIDNLTHVIPEWLFLAPDGRSFRDRRQNQKPSDPDSQMLSLARQHHVAVLPLINNYDEKTEQFRPDWLHTMLSDPSRRHALILSLKGFLIRSHFDGINIDFETEAAEDRDYLTAFMSELYQALHPVGLLVTQSVQVGSEAFDLAALDTFSDWMVPMLYDEHYAGSMPGPVASLPWFRQTVRRLAQMVPPEKLVLGIGTQSYDWIKGHRGAESTTFQQAVLTAKESEGVVRLDPASLNPTFTYADDSDRPHEVWLLDAISAYNQILSVRSIRPLGAALWYVGSEDPAIWTFFAHRRLGQPVRPSLLEEVRYGYEVDFEGEGEILSVQSLPTTGERALKCDPQTGLIVSETYRNDLDGKHLLYPSSYVIRRYARTPKTLALTFDDGPDPTYTPQILKILRDNGVNASFFVIGQNVENHPDLVRRIWEEGNDIGNHTFTHPDLSRTSAVRTDLELNATQRAIESILGRGTTLFRPPYAADAEPQTSDEILPLVRAERLHYLTIGELIDPTDWDTAHTNAERIVQYVLTHRNDGNVILLHDGGGNRQATIEALPRIISALKQQGYRFVTISGMFARLGHPRSEVFPPVNPAEHLLVGVDKVVFKATYLVHRLLQIFFGLAILLGISRVLLTGLLTLIQHRRSRRRVFLQDFFPKVSVVIAAYNEEKVIARTVEAILSSDYPDLQVIVVDDGSQDHTAEVIREHFHGDPRIHCISKPNGGKASALNTGIGQAGGEIIVSLDADTIFAQDTISKLVRHFQDPRVGAVSGNVKVGNRINLLTRWQAIEYITSQHFDRRAFDLLNCITVVPGAVGAWRRSAIEAAGLYTSDTLAEDTDLTFKIRKLGFRIVTESDALAYTEAPDNLKNLSKQRFRWAFGTLQNLWKHRDALFRSRYGTFGWIAMPGLWIYQILFQAISPVVDVAILWSLFHGNIRQVLFFYALFFLLELSGALLAFSLDREDLKLLGWLFWQRFLYRQLIYYVILKSILNAFKGGPVGWGKFERKGTVKKISLSEIG